MSDRLPRSNSQSNLPNYGQDKAEDKNTNVGTGNKDASALSDKNASRGNGENKQAKPQLKSKEEKKVGDFSQSSSDPVIDLNSPFGKLFLNQQPGRVRKEADQSEDSSSEDQLPKSPRQQQSNQKEKTTNKKVPKLSLENLGNALKGLASDRREMTISPRKTHRDTQDSTSNTQHKVANTTTTAATTTTTTTANATIVPKTSNVTTATTAASQADVTTGSKPSGAIPASLLTAGAIEAINLALTGKDISGDQLAEVLICVQSAGYTKPLESSMVDTIFRSGMVVSDFTDPHNPEKKIKVNIIEILSSPFIKKHIDTHDMQILRENLTSRYKKLIQDLPPDLKTLSAKELRKNKIFSKLMKPLINSFLEKFIGNELKLQNSVLSQEFKNLLQGIDSRVSQWAKIDGKIQPNVLFEARKSALAAYVCTRSITPIWRLALNSDPDFKKYNLEIFTSYLNTLLTTQIDGFYFDIMSSFKNQDPEQKKLLDAHKKANALMSQESSRKEKIENTEREKAEKKKGNPVSLLTSLISPRKEIKSPRQSENDLVKQNLNRPMQVQQNRRKEVDTLVRKTGASNVDSQFLHHLKQTILDLPRSEYQIFKKNPAGFALKALEQYVFDNVDGSNYDVENLLKFKEKLERLIDDESAYRLNETNASPGISGTITATVTSDSATARHSVMVSDRAPATVTQSATIAVKAEVSENDSSTASEEQALSNLKQAQSDDQSSSRNQ